MSQSNPPPAQRPLTTSTLGIDVRIGHALLRKGTTAAALGAAIEDYNRDLRLPGLPDHLNPEIIDAAKATSLLAALMRHPQSSLQQLAGKALHLSYAGLRVGAAAPTTPDSFSMPFGLEVVDIQGETVLARVNVPSVMQIVRERSAEARKQLAAEVQQVQSLEPRLRAAAGTDQDKRLLDELTLVRRRRSAVARVWQASARELSELAVADTAAKADYEAASKAASEYLLPGGVGMPR